MHAVDFQAVAGECISKLGWHTTWRLPPRGIFLAPQLIATPQYSVSVDSAVGDRNQENELTTFGAVKDNQESGPVQSMQLSPIAAEHRARCEAFVCQGAAAVAVSRIGPSQVQNMPSFAPLQGKIRCCLGARRVVCGSHSL